MPHKNWNLFFINESRQYICNKKKPQDIYKHFHNKIAKRQEQHLRILRPILELIDIQIRHVNLITDDEIEKRIILEKTQMLSKLSNDILNLVSENDSEFLQSLEKILKYKFTEII
jgi:hypothetical protein